MAGVQFDSTGAPLLLSDSHSAANTYGLNSLHLTAAPKPNFLFYVNFARVGVSNTSPTSLVPLISSTLTQSQSQSTNIGFVVKQIDRPKVSFEIETLNQYNKKRVIQKKVEYGPINIQFRDTADNRVFKMFVDYFRFYYGDAQSRSDSAWINDVISGTFTSPAAGWGFIANNLAASMRDYFSQLEVYSFFNGNYSQFNLLNPKIISFAPDQLDYTGGGTFTHEVALTITYEGINYIINSEPLANNPSLAATVGLNNTNFYEEESGPFPVGNDTISSNYFSDLTNNSNINSLIANTVNGVLATPAATSNSINVNGLSGNLTTAAQVPVNNALTSSLGNIGTINTSYNSSNTGTLTSLALSNTPALRGVSITDPSYGS